jgi:hypothetical protein
MKRSFPTVGEYNQLFLKFENNTFSKLKGVKIIPSRSIPIKVFLFGSGAYAAVFKGELNGIVFAIRCFLTPENLNIHRNKVVSEYLSGVQASWKTNTEFLDDEINYKGQFFPILKMDWVEGVLINEFITKHLSDDKVISEVQKKLMEISTDLESRGIGHGDLQCGNILVCGTATKFTIKLIDYDGMFVPKLAGQKSTELGRSEFQHPKRTYTYFNEKIDRFSIWVILAALEALKYDKSLWLETMQGGYNTLDNFLFVLEDFQNPYNSKLFAHLNNLNSEALTYYLDNLRNFCQSDISEVKSPKLYTSKHKNDNHLKIEKTKLSDVDIKKDIITEDNTMFHIISKNQDLEVLSSTFQKLGKTPIKLDKSFFEGKTVIVSNGAVVKQINLTPDKNLIEIDLRSQEITPSPQNISKHKEEWGKINKKLTPEVEIKPKAKQVENQINPIPAITGSKNIIQKNEDILLSVLVASIIIFFCVFFIIKYNETNITESKNKDSVPAENTSIIMASEEEVQSDPIMPLEKTIIPKSKFDGTIVIKNFLKAEEERSFDRIFMFFSPNISRYYEEYNPTYNDLKTQYERVWTFTENTSNIVIEISPIDQNENKYKLITIYKYTNKLKLKNYQIRSILHFEFDSNGKIKGIYSMASKVISELDIETDDNWESIDSLEENNGLTDISLQNHQTTEKLTSGGYIVKNNNGFALSDQSGRIITPYMFSEIRKMGSGLLKVRINGLWGILNEDGARITPVKYNRISYWTDGLAMVYANSKYGYINERGQEVIPLEYDEASDFYSGMAKVTFKGKQIYINKDGNLSNNIGESGLKIHDSYNTKSKKQTQKNSVKNYKFKTVLNDVYSEIYLRIGPNVTSTEIYKCPKSAEVYVIDNSDDLYFKVSINGNIGYLIKHALVRKN